MFLEISYSPTDIMQYAILQKTLKQGNILYYLKINFYKNI